MDKQFQIFDPIQMKTYLVDFNELRFWINVPMLQRLFQQSSAANQSFQFLDGEQREYLLQLLDKNEKVLPFKIKNWNGIPGFNTSFHLDVVYSIEADAFHDKINQEVKDKLFLQKKIHTVAQEGGISISGQNFPISTMIAVSEDFITEEEMEPTQPYPIFQNYLGNGTEYTDRFFLNYRGDMEPMVLQVLAWEEENWQYIVTATIEPAIDHESVLWSNVPKVKNLFEFFSSEGFKARADGPHRTYFENKERGDIIEYNVPPEHLYTPFISIRQHQFKTDYISRKKLGDKLLKQLKDAGLWEEVLYFRAYLLETEALSKIQNKNKRPADMLLSEAIIRYDECSEQFKGQAQLEAVFCAWLKSRIALLKEDKGVERKSYQNMLERYKGLHAWEDFLWLLDHIGTFNRQLPYQLVKEYMPISTLDKYYFMKPNTYKRILEYWDKGVSYDKRPKKGNISEWHYNLAQKAYDIGLKDTANYHLSMFFKLTEKNPEGSQWAIEGTEELLDFAIKVGARKQYLKFAQTMAKFMGKKRKQESIGDMSAIGRKAYRWTLLSLTLSEARWAFHAGYLLKKANKEKMDLIKHWFRHAYEAFYEAVLHYDPTEDYTSEQTVLIGKGFVTAYHLGFAIRDENLMSWSLQLANELWENNHSKELYLAIHGIFQTEDRQKMADKLISTWIEKVKEEEGSFVLDIEKVIILSDLYLSVEEWEETAKTLKYGLTKLQWDFESLDKIFKTFLSLQKFAPSVLPICEEDMFSWIQKYQHEKQNSVSYMTSVRSRIKKITKV